MENINQQLSILNIRERNKDNMRNNLTDLNNHLFEQIERLNDEELQGEALKEEINRSKAIENVAKQIINNGRLVLDSQKFVDERINVDNNMPSMLDNKNG